MTKKKNDFEEMGNTILKGSMALQATPMLKASGRTTAALTNTASGFVGLGITGSVQQMAFGMVRPSNRTYKKKKTKRR